MVLLHSVFLSTQKFIFYSSLIYFFSPALRSYTGSYTTNQFLRHLPISEQPIYFPLSVSSHCKYANSHFSFHPSSHLLSLFFCYSSSIFVITITVTSYIPFFTPFVCRLQRWRTWLNIGSNNKPVSDWSSYVTAPNMNVVVFVLACHQS